MGASSIGVVQRASRWGASVIGVGAMGEQFGASRDAYGAVGSGWVHRGSRVRDWCNREVAGAPLTAGWCRRMSG